MNPLRAITAAGVVGAATLGSSLLADLCGVPDNVAHGQTVMTRTPSVLDAPSGYAAAPGYNRLPSHYSYAAPSYSEAPSYSGAPTYNATPAFTRLPPPSPYGFSAYPASGYQPNPYASHPTGLQSSWPYVQSDGGQTNVLLRRSELHGGPPLGAPPAQAPVPAPVLHNPVPTQRLPHPTMPTYQAPNQMQTQMMPGYAAPGYGDVGATCDAWANDASINRQPLLRNWFGSIGGLYMTRDHGDHFTFSYGTGNEADQRTDTRNADMDWAGGFDVRFGRYFNCQQNAIEAVYWGIFPGSQSTQTVSADVLGELNGILNWDSLDYGGANAGTFVNVAPGDDGVHRLTRDYAFHNVELNLWRFCGSCGAGNCDSSRLRNNWLIGVRYFRFDENLLFASDANDVDITYENDEIFYNVDIENHLVGFQIGNEAQYCVSDRLTADLGIKLGVYANQINHLSEIGGNLGVATINNGPFINEEFWISTSKNDVAFLGEVNLGLRYCFSHCWTGTLGYRALAVTGVAMPADQIYPDLRGINDVANIDSSRGLILHGGYAGIEYNW